MAREGSGSVADVSAPALTSYKCKKMWLGSFGEAPACRGLYRLNMVNGYITSSWTSRAYCFARSSAFVCDSVSPV